MPQRSRVRTSWGGPLLLVVILGVPGPVLAEDDQHTDTAPGPEHPVRRAALFAAGVAGGLAAHEGGHVLFNVVFDAEPGLRRVEFGGVPFFAITHRGDVSPRREYSISAAGFWTQHALSEWMLTAAPDLRRRNRPFAKGVLAWHLLSSGIYTVAAFGRLGPPERDTRGMAEALGISERWVGLLLVVPAACDLWRYFDPEARWARWVSRTVKIGLVLAVAGAGR